jgi:hypothetical protein
MNFFISVNRYLSLTVYKINEYMYWEYNVIISKSLKSSLQEFLDLVFVII